MKCVLCLAVHCPVLLYMSITSHQQQQLKHAMETVSQQQQQLRNLVDTMTQKQAQLREVVDTVSQQQQGGGKKMCKTSRWGGARRKRMRMRTRRIYGGAARPT